MKKRKGSKVKFDGKEILDVALAALIVNDSPALVGQFTGKVFTGISEDIVGGGLGVVIGMIAKNRMLTNASLAVAIFNIANGYIMPQLMNVTGKIPTTTKPAINKVSSVPPALADFVTMPRNLGEYVGGSAAGAVSSYNQYARNYSRN